MKKKVVIIGGGASGIVAAITAAREGCDVTIIDHRDQFGKKILLTGNGKCNLTNLAMETKDYITDNSRADFVESVLARVSPDDIVSFFHSIGLQTTVLHDSYVYPITETAKTVMDVFMRELKSLSIQLIYNTHMKQFYFNNDSVHIECDSLELDADSIIIACGGNSFPKTGSDGSALKMLKRNGILHVPFYPALTSLICSNEHLKVLSGLRQNAQISIYHEEQLLDTEYGQIQFTDYGLSGIPVFCASSYIVPELLRTSNDKATAYYNQLIDQHKGHIYAVVDLFPNLTQPELFSLLEAHLKHSGNSTVKEALYGFIHDKWIAYFSNKIGNFNRTVSELDEIDISELTVLFKEIRFDIEDLKGFDFCQVSGGGVCLSEINNQCELLQFPNVYVIGELLDYTGKCGGYNLHMAFATGIIAGKACAK